MNRKKILFSLFLLCYVLIAGGCGSGGSSKSSDAEPYAISSTENSDSEESGVADKTDGGSEEGTETPEKSSDNTSEQINTEMLVYSCNLKIDTLDYDKSVETFKTMLSAANGFIEEEKYSDGSSSSDYYVEDSDKKKTYTATVRVPHDKYEDFLNGTSTLGDIRSKTSNVENLSQEYSDLNTSLEIYEAKEKRYIKLLSTITDDSHAVSVEKELTELQVKIAGIKTRMKEIKTDVSYSTIDIRIREVSKYTEKPKKTDTFFQRLGKTIKDTWSTFLSFLEGCLFLGIRLSPYAVILGLIIYAIYRYDKKHKAKKTEKNEGTT